MKGYKVTDKSRTKLMGVACDSLGQLVDVGRRKLNIDEDVTVALEDGTIVDDEEYFQGVPAQTVLVLYRKSEDIVTGVDFVLNVLRNLNSSYLETGLKASEALLGKSPELIGLLTLEDEERLGKNTRAEDPEWFTGLDTNASCKEEYMNRKSQERIRGYFYKFQEDVRKSSVYKSDSVCRKTLEECLAFFRGRLKRDKYFGCYFDRRCAGRRQGRQPARKKAKVADGYDLSSFCDGSGTFACQGKWELEMCEYLDRHHINPYSSREARIVFSTWNLDHRIEKSRTLVPTLVEAAESCGKSRSVNFPYFYGLLFTKINLKLVHVVCHDKSAHNVKCDSRFLFR